MKKVKIILKNGREKSVGKKRMGDKMRQRGRYREKEKEYMQGREGN